MRTFGQLVLQRSKAGRHQWSIPKMDPHVCIKLKAVFHKIARGMTIPFYFDDTPENSRELAWFMDRYPLEVSEDDRLHLALQKASQLKKLANLEKLESPDYIPKEYPLKLPLRHYQAQAVDIFFQTKRLLVGDAVGLGKTAIAIGAFTNKKLLPAVVVVQTHLPVQWGEQIKKFTDLTVHFIKGTKPYNLPPADVYIMRYSCLAGWVDTYQLKFFKTVVFDEVQELRHDESRKYGSGYKLASSCEYAMGLSATPIYNYAEEIYNILDLIAPEALDSKESFMREWSADWKFVKQPQALGTYLREQFLFLRRTRVEVKMELPVVNKIVHEVEHDQAEVDKITALAYMLATKVTTGTFVERGQAARELDIMMRQMTGVSKAKFVAAYVKILLEGGESVLLAGWHRAVYDIWMNELVDFKPVLYTGSESPAEKEKAKQAFIDGSTQLMIISLRSGIGLDGLQNKSSIVVFGELDWSPQVHEQVIGRLDRDGQKGQVTAIFLVSNSGSDPLLVELLGLKASQSHSIIDPLTAPTSHPADISRIQLLAQRFLEKHHHPQATSSSTLPAAPEENKSLPEKLSEHTPVSSG